MSKENQQKLSDELKWRGFVNQTTYSDMAALDGDPITFYWGVDPSADSMTIGHLAPAMMIRHFINYGHKPILLVGGATGLIGDPDGKAQERDLKTRESIEHNKQAIARQYREVFNGQSFDMVDNYDWFREINYLGFLRDIGKHASMTQMLDREFVQSRIGEGGSGISYAEFSYSLIQGYDFLHLYRTKGATLQVAGADQWGNSLMGTQLIRQIEGAEAHVYTVPLIINKSTGRKFGKSEEGAIWLDENKTSVYQFYQFWLNVDDESVVDFLKVYTMLSREEISALELTIKTNPGERQAQKRLAYEATALVHGEDRAETARNVSQVLFGGRPFDDLLKNEIDMLALEIPESHATDVMGALTSTEVVKSNSEARRLIESGAVTVNGEKVIENITLAQACLVKKGKNSFILVR